MVTTTSLKVGESLSIGLYFNDNYQLPTTCNLIVFIGGVCVGNLFTHQPEIDRVGAYYTIRLSSQDTSKMRGYRDLIVILDDPEGFGNKKTIVGGILFDRMADEFITTSENQGYNMLIGMTVNQSIVSGNVELIEAIKGDKGEDAVLPDGIVVDLNYVHTDNNYTDNEKSVISNTSGINTGDQDLSNLLSLQHLSDFNHADIIHNNRIALDFVSGINTGDQDLSGLATKLELASGLLLKVDKEAGKQLSTEDYTTAEKNKVANVPLNTNAELGLKVDKVEGSSLVPDEDIITLQNTSGINTGDQLTDNETITGSGKSNDPFIANIKIIESEIPPSNPIQGLRWFNLTNGIEYTYIQDTWIDLNGNTFLLVDHESLIDKNSEAEFQHVDTTTTKTTLDAADKVALYDSVTGKMVLSTVLNDIETILASI